MSEPVFTASLIPEFQFMLHATRWPHDPDALASIQSTSQSIRDPDLLLALARRHHVVGLVSRAISYCAEWSDSQLREVLRADALSLAEEQFRQIIQTRQAVSALQDQDIPVAVLKGAPTALEIFGEVGVRTSVDIDLLIARQDLDRANAVLSENGYLRSIPPHDATTRQVQIANRYGKDWGFDHFHSDTGIELHWRLFQNPHLLPKIGLANAVDTAVLPGIVLPALPITLSALYLIAHGAEHAWSRLKWLADLAAILRKNPEMADTLLDHARQHNIAHMTMAALMLSHALYDTALPKQDHQKLAMQWRTRKLFEIARNSLIGEQDALELEDRHMATTHKNMGHYLFSTNPRYWWREAAYDLFHDSGSNETDSTMRRILQRIGKVFKAPNPPATA